MVDRVVGFDIADAFGDRARRQLFENFLAHRSSTSVSARKVEVDAEQFDQARALVGIERLDDGAEIRFVQIADQPAQGFDVAGRDGLDHAAEIPPADRRHRRRAAVF